MLFVYCVLPKIFLKHISCTQRRVAEGGAKHSALNITKQKKQNKTTMQNLLKQQSNLHAAVILKQKQRRKICKSMHAAVMFSKVNGLNSKAKIFPASKDFDPPRKIKY